MVTSLLAKSPLLTAVTLPPAIRPVVSMRQKEVPTEGIIMPVKSPGVEHFWYVGVVPSARASS